MAIGARMRESPGGQGVWPVTRAHHHAGEEPRCAYLRWGWGAGPLPSDRHLRSRGVRTQSVPWPHFRCNLNGAATVAETRIWQRTDSPSRTSASFDKGREGRHRNSLLLCIGNLLSALCQPFCGTPRHLDATISSISHTVPPFAPSFHPQ